MVAVGEYGVVRVSRGELKGRLVYYDNETVTGRRAIVYLGSPLDSEERALPFNRLEPATPEERARFEAQYLAPIAAHLRRRMDYRA